MKKNLYLPFLMLCFHLKAQIVLPKDNLDKVIQLLVDKYKIPNAVVAITNKDSIIYTYTTLLRDFREWQRLSLLY